MEDLTEIFNKIIANTPVKQPSNKAPVWADFACPTKSLPLSDDRYDRNGKFTPSPQDK